MSEQSPATDEELANAARGVMHSTGMAATTPEGLRLHTPEELVKAYRQSKYVTLHASASLIALRATKTG